MEDYDKIYDEINFKFDKSKCTNGGSFLCGVWDRMRNMTCNPNNKIKDHNSYEEGYNQCCEALLTAKGYRDSRFYMKIKQ